VGFLLEEGQCPPQKDPTLPQGSPRHRLLVH